MELKSPLLPDRQPARKSKTKRLLSVFAITFCVSVVVFLLMVCTHNDGSNKMYERVTRVDRCEFFRADTTKEFSEFSSYTISSPSPGCNDVNVVHKYLFNDQRVQSINVEFFENTTDLESFDSLVLSSLNGKQTILISESGIQPYVINGNGLILEFKADSTIESRYSFEVTPLETEGPLTVCQRFLRSQGASFDGLGLQIIESPHPICEHMSFELHYFFSDERVTQVQLEVDRRTNLWYSDLWIYYSNSDGNEVRFRLRNDRFSQFTIPSSDFRLEMNSASDASVFGYRFNAIPLTSDVEGNSCDNFENSSGKTFPGLEAQFIESPHPYCLGTTVEQRYEFGDPSIEKVLLELSWALGFFDSLVVADDERSMVIDGLLPYSQYFTVHGRIFTLDFHSGDSEAFLYGYSMTATPILSGQDPCDWFLSGRGEIFDDVNSHVIHSLHPYCNNMSFQQHFGFSDPEVIKILIKFSSLTSIELWVDTLEISYDSPKRRVVHTFSGRDLEALEIESREFDLIFKSDDIFRDYGYEFTIIPLFRQDPELFLNCDGYDNVKLESHDRLDLFTVESPHPYCDNMSVLQKYSFLHPEVEGVTIVFNSATDIEPMFDILSLQYRDSSGMWWDRKYSGNDFQDIGFLDTTEILVLFESDSSDVSYGYAFKIIPLLFPQT
eukprot:CAMPEP_0114989866 /NCGR_PEP_ID=MMETSP0216-20121206/10443_1 /TAXON_ID=223996 /ORGANISM="Protocruzia adherens, Strain Boccale" /LENGTH=666 /DNA_ID=CAMNT_0002352907 /DNA_START=88 /DNA_END=2088 /DNA_ORIENTATION=+